MTITKEHVYALLNNAVENDYDLREWSAEQIADDLIEYGSFEKDNVLLEEIDPHELVPFIQMWLDGRP